MKHLSIISPVCNEEGNIEAFAAVIKKTMSRLPYTYTLLFVDDGSADATLSRIKCIACKHQNVRYISLSRNFGHQNALKAGFDMSCGDCVITIDGDMQHPVDLIPVMLEKYEQGYDVVYTLRKEDKNLPFLKRKTSGFFYSFINRLSDIKIERGSADFRLFSQRVAGIIRNLPEHDLFFRGLSKWVGFRQLSLEYEADKRFSGVSKYTFRKMVKFALCGISSFSTKPLYVAAYLGFTFSLLSLLYVPYAVYSYFFGYAISGWASVIVTIAFFGGIQLMILGIIGVYIGRLFIQSKNRPNYIVKESNLL